MFRVIAGLFILLVYVFTYALCRTAAEADRQAEMIYAQRMKELEGK